MSEQKLEHEPIGRLENELVPDAPEQGVVREHPIVGRTYNERKAGGLHRINLPHPIVGRIYNELRHGHPRRKIGRIYNDKLDR